MSEFLTSKSTSVKSSSEIVVDSCTEEDVTDSSSNFAINTAKEKSTDDEIRDEVSTIIQCFEELFNNKFESKESQVIN